MCSVIAGDPQAPRSTKERFAQEIIILIQRQNNLIDEQLPQTISAEANKVWIDLQEQKWKIHQGYEYQHSSTIKPHSKR